MAPEEGDLVVGALGIANDILETVLFLVIPPLLWLLLLWIAWTDPALGRVSGFTRPIFWLLLPGAIIGTYGNLPLFPWNGDVLAIDVGGAAIPLVLSMWLLARAFGDRARLWAMFAAAFGAQGVIALVGEFQVGPGLPYTLLLLVACGATVVGMAIVSALVGPESRPTARRVTALLVLSDAALVATFLTTQSIPGYGIVSNFPWFLAIPLVLGAIVAGFARPLFGRPPYVGLGIGYAVTTFGVLFGADLLRQPPLYGSSGYILSIGGAGTNDLVFLSGLLAVLAGLVTLRVARARPETTDGWTPSYARAEPPRAGPILRQSLRLAVAGSPKPSLALSEEAVRVAEDQARRLLRQPAPPHTPNLDGLPAPPWIVADWQNLRALAAIERPLPRDSTRGWLTARWIVRFLSVSSARRFGTFSRRTMAFLVDLVVITIPGTLLWAATIASSPGSAVDALSSVPVNAAVYLYAAGGFLYFVVSEGAYGTTLGKWLLHLEVRDRTLALPDGIASMLRNLPKLIPLTTIAIGGIAALALATRGLPGGASGFLGTDVATGVYLLIAIGGVVLPGLVSLAVMSVSPERQRLGDWFAGTWVINEAA